MLEIILIINIAKKLGAIAQERGRSKGWAALGVAFWFIGEIIGFVIGGLLGLQGLAAYPVALALAALGLVVAWQVVKNLPMESAQVA